MPHVHVRASTGFISPQLPTLAAKPPPGDGWIHEIKRDGFRAIVKVEGGWARIFTRSGLDWTARYGALPRFCAEIARCSALLDGEIVVQRGDGTCDFGAMQDAVSRGRGPFVLFAFDLLRLDAQDLRRLPLIERKAMLAELLRDRAADPCFPVRYVDHLDGAAEAFFRLVCERGLEGIVSKRAHGQHQSGRSREWLKVKNFERTTLVVIGRVRRPSGPEEFLVAEEAGAGLRYVGRAMNALPGHRKHTLAERLIERATAPIAGLRVPGATWIEPQHRVSVRHLATSDTLRHATVDAVGP